MKKTLLIAGLTVTLASCSFLAPYQMTFTTRENEAIDPSKNTLDLVINNPALAYVSSYQCGDAAEVSLLPVVKDGMVAQTVWYLPLDFLSDQTPGTLCTVNVSAFDKTTTANSNKKISLYMYSMPIEGATDTGTVVEESATGEVTPAVDLDVVDTVIPSETQP